MLLLEPPLPSVAGLALFRDHADASLVHYLWTRPRLAVRDGRPELAFQRYVVDPALAPARAGEATGGGFLTFTVELAPSDEELAAARRVLQKAGVEAPRLVPMDVRAGLATLVVARAEAGADPEHGLRLFDQLLGETHPDLRGRLQATFALSMPSIEAASLVEGMLRAGGGLLGVRYQLEYIGLRPALAVRVHAEAKRVRAAFEATFSAGIHAGNDAFEVSVGKTVTSLRESGAVQVEVTTFTDDADWKRQAELAVRWFEKDLVEALFRPALAAQNDLAAAILAAAKTIGVATLAALLDDDAAVEKVAGLLGVPSGLVKQGATDDKVTEAPAVRIGFTLRDEQETTERSLDADYRASAAEKRTASPQGLLTDAGAALGGSQVREVVLGEDWFSSFRLEVRLARPLAGTGVSELVVDLEYPGERAEGAPTTKTASLRFDAATAGPLSFSAWTRPGEVPSFRYRTSVRFAADSPWWTPEVAPHREVEGGSSRTRQLVIDPLAGIEVRRIEVAASPEAFAESSELAVELALGAQGSAPAGAPSLSMSLTAAQPTRTFQALVVDPALSHVWARPTWRMTAQAPVVGAWRPVGGAALLVDGPWRSRRTVRIVPLLSPEILEAHVTARLVAGGGPEQRVSFAAGDTRSVPMVLGSLEEAPAPVSVTALLVRRDGSSFEMPALVSDAPVVPISDADGPVRRVELSLAGAGAGRLAEAGLSAVRVQLLDAAGMELDSVLFTESAQGPAELSAPSPAGKPFSYRCRVTRYGSDGVAEPPEEIEGSDARLLIAMRRAG